MVACVFSIAPAQITIDATSTYGMRRIIRIFDGCGMEGGKLRFDGIEPGSVGWQVNRFHIMPGKEFVRGTDIRREIIQHHVNPQLHRIAFSQASETGQDVLGGFAFTDTTHQAIGMDIIEAMQLLHTLFARVGGAMTFGMTVTCPTPARNRAQFEWP